MSTAHDATCSRCNTRPIVGDALQPPLCAECFAATVGEVTPAPCAKCGAPSTCFHLPHGSAEAFRSCARCAGLEASELWVVEHAAGGHVWHAARSESEARRAAEAMRLSTPGLPAEAFAVRRYVCEEATPARCAERWPSFSARCTLAAGHAGQHLGPNEQRW